MVQEEVEQLLFPEKHEMLYQLDKQTGPHFQRLNAAVRSCAWLSKTVQNVARNAGLYAGSTATDT